MSSSTPSSSSASSSLPKLKCLGGSTCPEQIFTDIQISKTFPPNAITNILNSAFDIARRVVLHDEVGIIFILY